MQDGLALCLTVNIYGSPGNSLVRHFETSTLTSERNYGDESPCNCAAWPKSVLNIRMEINITRQQTAATDTVPLTDALSWKKKTRRPLN